jgi:hypothetical protein
VLGGLSQTPLGDLQHEPLAGRQAALRQLLSSSRPTLLLPIGQPVPKRARQSRTRAPAPEQTKTHSRRAEWTWRIPPAFMAPGG